MTVQLDHLILVVNDLPRTVAFYVAVMGFTHDGDRPPFTVIRVSPDFVIQLAPWGTEGGEHLAFAMSRDEFDAAFRRIRDAAIPYGDSFDQVGNMMGPGAEPAARGIGQAVYFFDPNQHLIEIRHYEG